MKFGIGIIGCGFIGNKRANSLGRRGKLIACCDTDTYKAKSLAIKHGAEVYEDWKEIVKLDNVNIIIISTLHNSLAEITYYAAKHKKHVLVEKPAARNLSEIKKLEKKLINSKVKIRVGFNHRYHRSILKAQNIIESGKIGDLMFLRARYGHGGRLGYDKEWRSDMLISGGGELIDQGPHLIDLASLFLKDTFKNVNGIAKTFYWNMKVDDNAFLTLETKGGCIAFLHVSCTEWKNLFSIEIYGKKGKIELNGLGGSYGTERVTFYKMLKTMGPPETYSWEYPMPDNSWEYEINKFYDDITQDRNVDASLLQARLCHEVIEKIYKDSKYL